MAEDLIFNPLLKKGFQYSGGGGGGALPVANYDTLGGIKLNPSSFIVDDVLYDSSFFPINFESININNSVVINTNPIASLLQGWIFLDGKFTLANSVSNESLFTLNPSVLPFPPFNSIPYSIIQVRNGYIPGYILENGVWNYRPELFDFTNFVLSPRNTLSAADYYINLYLPAMILFNTP